MVERTNSCMLTSHMYSGVHPHTHKHVHTPHTDTVLTGLHNSPNCLGCTPTSMLFSMSLHLFLSMKGVPLSGSRAHSPAASHGARLGRGQTILFLPGLRGHLNIWINQCVCASAKGLLALYPGGVFCGDQCCHRVHSLPASLSPCPVPGEERGSHSHDLVFSPHTCRTVSRSCLHLKCTCVPRFLPGCLLTGQSLQ